MDMKNVSHTLGAFSRFVGNDTMMIIIIRFIAIKKCNVV